jgi:hypothetical membrane protein
VGGVFGLAAVALYAAFTGIAAKMFPWRLSPDKVFISILGMSKYNPDGAVFYNSAMIACGVFGLLFFAALHAWYPRTDRGKLLIVGSTAGLINGLSVAMTGVFAEDVNRTSICSGAT